MSTALTQQRAVEIAEERLGYPSFGVFNGIREKDLHAAMEQYHREASARHSADCPNLPMPDGFPQGPLDELCTPVECPICSPQKPASVEPVAWITHSRNGMLRSILTTKTPDESLMPGDVQKPLYTTPPDAEALRKRVSELEAEVEQLHALWKKSASNAEHWQTQADKSDRERDEAREAASRWRYVRDSEDFAIAANIEVIDYGSTGVAVTADMYNGEEADRLIDAALAAKGEQS